MKQRPNNTARAAFLGIAAAAALLLSYVEFVLPPLYAAIPGIKLGLPNVIIIYLLYTADVRSAALVSFVRIGVAAILFGSAMTLIYSVSGAVLSLAVMGILKKSDRLSAVGVSVAGGTAHNLGQILTAMVLLDTPQIALYMIVLCVTGTVSGIFIGLCGAQMIQRIPPRNRY